MENKGKWFSEHAAISIITYTITVAATVFTFSKFWLIDNTKNYYQAQLDLQQKDLEQYKSRVEFLEGEKQTLEDERNRYLDYLKSMPDSIYYLNDKLLSLENENNKLKEENTQITNSQEKYYYVSDNQKTNNTIIDSYTGLIVCMNEIKFDYTGMLTFTIPGLSTTTREVRAGDVIDFSFDNKAFSLIISNIDWVSKSYSIIIKEL